MLQTFKTKPNTIRAVQLTKENAAEMRKFLTDTQYDATRDGHDPVNIMLRNSHGNMLLRVGDWLIREPDGNGYYACDPQTFASKYEPAGVTK